ncbi:hypothetical protein [Roseitranquillus sediminis]|uniref:hypothetical protein n=1 Tax=Roseitranquillus sediminis TaxID=2809051 RepID=UPI001D0C6CBD|nr:hypothetical protein [Roseitranquillus sediminis]MBM9593892.1 hypothetical protein [Roseitranquillus sediminis]
MFRTSAMLVAAALLLGACTTGDPTARLLATGPNVRVDGAPAEHGTWVRQGATISTGAGSSAIVRWSEGTTLQLDQNSDPLVVWEPPDVAINVGVGWFLIDTGEMSVRIRNELAVVFVGSTVAVNVVPGQSLTTYLLEGSAQPLEPAGRPLREGEKLIAYPGNRLVYLPITPAERAMIEQRFERWDFPRSFQSHEDDDDYENSSDDFDTDDDFDDSP